MSEATSACVLALLLGAAVVACGSQTRDDKWEVCLGTEAAATVSACTGLLESGGLGTVDEATVFHSRGTARYRRGEWIAAIDDFNRAIERDPANPNNFH